MLIKSIPTQFGVNATCHIIGQTNIDWVNQSAQIVLYSWLDKDALENGATNLGGVEFKFDKEKFIFSDNKYSTLSDQIYTAILDMPEWADAERITPAEELFETSDVKQSTRYTGPSYPGDDGEVNSMGNCGNKTASSGDPDVQPVEG